MIILSIQEEMNLLIIQIYLNKKQNISPKNTQELIQLLKTIHMAGILLIINNYYIIIISFNKSQKLVSKLLSINFI